MIAIPEKVLVSVRDASSGREYDMELPSQMTIKMLAQGISRFFQISGLLRGSREIQHEIWYNDRKLRDNETLSSVGIWDGSTITIRERRAVDVSNNT